MRFKRLNYWLYPVSSVKSLRCFNSQRDILLLDKYVNIGLTVK